MQCLICGKDSAGEDEVESKRDEKIWIYEGDWHYDENRGGNDEVMLWKNFRF